MLTKPRTVCFYQPVVAMISASVAPLARFIIAMTSAFLLLRSLAAVRARSRHGDLVGDFFDLPFAGATSRAGFAPVGDSRWIAAQIRATADFRSVNFLIGLSSWNGATPAKLFQASISREIGHSPTNFASSFSG